MLIFNTISILKNTCNFLGDPEQLAPMTYSFDSRDRGYSVSMFERLLKLYALFNSAHAVN